MKRLIAFLLHHANRCVKDFSWGQFVGDFYKVKDQILSKYGKPVGYDIQHIEGKKCFKCKGTGRYDRWDQYGIYDPDGCWHCLATGWYRDPQWICLQIIQFCSYRFHKPLKREKGVTNPFTKESLGWNVSENPVIVGYIDHDETWFGKYALALIMIRTPDFKLIVKKIVRGWRWYWESKVRWIKGLFRTKKRVQYYPITNEPNDDLPF